MSTSWRDDLHWLDAAELATAFRAGTLLPSQLLAHLLERIDRLDQQLHVFIRLDREGARQSALASDRRYTAGQPLGPLDGVPVGVKDVIDVAGMPTTCHSRFRLDHLAPSDADCVRYLRNGGAVILGKLATHEFAIGGPAFDLPFPPARNPWNLAHHPGGSSSGAGAGVAAGLFPLAIGTDTAGSIRNPASACGIVGLKPAYHRISRRGVVPLAWSLDHVGVLARSVRDCATAVSVLSGEEVQKVADPDLRGVRIGYVRHFHETDMPADPEVASALDRTAADLKRAGADIRNVTLPPLAQFAAINRVILQAEGYAFHGQNLRQRPGSFAEITRKVLMPGAFLSAEDLLRAQRWRGELVAAIEAVFAEVDVLMCASSMFPPCRIDDGDAIARTYMAQARTPFNLAGNPALAMRSGQSSAGLPLSIQFAAAIGADDALIRVATAWEGMGGAFVPPPDPVSAP